MADRFHRRRALIKPLRVQGWRLMTAFNSTSNEGCTIAHLHICTLYCNGVYSITLFCSLQHSPVFKFVNIYYILIHCHKALQHCNFLQFEVEVWCSSTLTPFELIFTARPLKLHFDGIAGMAWWYCILLYCMVFSARGHLNCTLTAFLQPL